MSTALPGRLEHIAQAIAYEERFDTRRLRSAHDTVRSQIILWLRLDRFKDIFADTFDASLGNPASSCSCSAQNRTVQGSRRPAAARGKAEAVDELLDASLI